MVASGLALVTFVGLVAAGRLPATDLAQHALLLREVLDPATSPFYEFRPLAQNTTFYALAYLVHLLGFDFVEASRLVAALTIGLLPLAGGYLAAASRRSAALGAFALLGGFTLATTWGLLACVLGVVVFAMAVGISLGHARRPSVLRGVVLAVALILTYSTHAVSWILAHAVVAAVLVLHAAPAARQARGRAALLRLWPLVVSGAATVIAQYVWLASRPPTALTLHRAQAHEAGPSAIARIVELPSIAASFGTARPLFVPWLVLAALWLAGLAALAVVACGAARRARRLGIKVSPSTRLVAWGRRLLWPALLAALVLAYLVTPLTTGGVFMVYPRFLGFAAVVLPLVFPRVKARTQHWLGLAAAIAALWLVAMAQREVVRYERATSCVDTLAERARPGETLVNLVWVASPPGFTEQVDLYLGAEILARRGGILSFDFADYGRGAVGFRPGIERVPLWPVTGLPRRYEHAVHGREYTALFLLRPPFDVDAMFAPSGLKIERCGDMALVYDATVAPGSRPPTEHLPHAVGR